LDSDLKFIIYLSSIGCFIINSKVKSLSIEQIKLGSHRELEDMLTNEITQIEEDLVVIANRVPVNEKATLDILCRDDNGQLVVLQLSVSEDDAMFLYGIQSLDYVDKFKSFLKATYKEQKINDKEKPRLILIAPSFSDAIRGAAEGMKGLRIDLYEWEYLKLGDQKGLRLAPIFSLAPPKPKKPAESKREQKPEMKQEPEPEKEETQVASESPAEPEEGFKAEGEEKRKRKLF
jgi:hypothetical protein